MPLRVLLAAGLMCVSAVSVHAQRHHDIPMGPGFSAPKIKPTTPQEPAKQVEPFVGFSQRPPAKLLVRTDRVRGLRKQACEVWALTRDLFASRF